MLSADLAAAPVHRDCADASALLPGHIMAAHDGMRAIIRWIDDVQSTRCGAVLEIVSRMDLAQLAVSRSEADGLRAVQMHDGCSADALGTLV